MKILVAIDSSPHADGILDQVASRAWTKDTEFRIITATETTGHWDADDQYSNLCRVILNERTRRLAERMGNDLKISGEVIEGSASTVIIKAAKDWHADLIIIGSHGDTGVRKAGIGSVAAAVVNESPCSVEVVKIHRARGQKPKALASAKTNS